MALIPTTLTYMVVDSGSGTSTLVVHSTSQGIPNSTAQCVIPLDAGHAGGTVRIQSEGEPRYDGARVIGSSGTLYSQIALNTQAVDTTINYTSAETSLTLQFVKDGSQNNGADMATFTVTETATNTGIPVAPTRLSVSDEGTASAPTALTVQEATGTAAAASALTVTAEGAASAATDLTMQASTGAASAATDLTVEASAGAIVAATDLTVSWPVGGVSCATALTVSAAGAPGAATALAVTAPGHHPNWSLRCLIDGVDVSSRITGIASVTAEEGAARIASLAISPESGVIAPLDYVGKTISIDYVLIIAGVDVPRRLFTGRIDTPSYDPDATLLKLDCVDDLQNRVAALPRSVIDALVGGRYTEAVQGDILDNWDYAEARLSTVAASLDAGPEGGLRLTPWESASVWTTLGAPDLMYERMSLELPQRSTLVNRVDVGFQYRYPRLRQRYSNIAWSGTLIDMAPAGYQYPTQADILSAASGTGWSPTLGIFYPAPTAIPHSSGGFIHPAADAIDLAIIYMTQRHSQTVTESYALIVKAPESIAANGELPYAIRGALASEFDGGAWESALDVAPLMPAGGDMDYAPDATRADSDYAIQTLLDQARVKILGSHRSARVGNAVLCNPELDVDKRIAISTGSVTATGKVASVTHTLDIAAGSAISEFEIACFGVGGAGIITPDTLAPPDPPAEAAEKQDWVGQFPLLMVNVYGQTPYQEALTGLLINPPQSITVDDVPTVDGPQTQSFPNPHYVAGAYPVSGFRVAMPGVDDADRNPLEKPVSGSYSLLIPADTLTFTVP